MTDSFATGSELIKLAVAADANQQFDVALDNYTRAVNFFFIVLRHERNEQAKQQLQTRISSYIKRVEELKQKKKPAMIVAAAHVSMAPLPMAEYPHVKWSDVAGLEDAKQLLKEAVILPRLYPELFAGKFKPWTGILLYGVPGTGKTHLARALATEAKSVFYNVSSSDLLSKFVGDSEKTIRDLFVAAHAADHAIIFFDEIDALAGARRDGDDDSSRRIKTELLLQMSAITPGKVLVLGATNLPWTLDVAMRRRLEKRIYVPLPDREARMSIVQSFIPTLSHDELGEMANKTELFSGSDLSTLCKTANAQLLRMAQRALFFKREGDYVEPLESEDPPCAHCPMKLSSMEETTQTCEVCGTIRSNVFLLAGQFKLKLREVGMRDMEMALQSTPATIQVSELARYEEWTQLYGS